MKILASVLSLVCVGLFGGWLWMDATAQARQDGAGVVITGAVDPDQALAGVGEAGAGADPRPDLDQVALLLGLSAEEIVSRAEAAQETEAEAEKKAAEKKAKEQAEKKAKEQAEKKAKEAAEAKAKEAAPLQPVPQTPGGWCEWDDDDAEWDCDDDWDDDDWDDWDDR